MITEPGTQCRSIKPHLDELESIFDDMTLEYDTVSGQYGFRCQGCDDNCCETHFHHHTLIEYFFLKKGLDEKDAGERRRLYHRAETVVRGMAGRSVPDRPVRIMCPLNSDGLCTLYAYRPMICRLHGIPHELRKPGGNVAYSPGCDRFTRQCGGKSYIPFDRTPHYTRLAGLEKALRTNLGFSGSVNMTVAQMILDIGGGSL